MLSHYGIFSASCRILFWICGLVCLPEFLSAQGDRSKALIWADSIAVRIDTDQYLDAQTKSNLADSVFHIYQQANLSCPLLKMRVAQATQLDNIGLSDSALVQLYWAQRHYTSDCDSLVLMTVYRTLASVLISLQELERCDSVCHSALALWNPAWKEKRIRLAILTNLGISQATLGHIEEADSTFHITLHEAQIAHEPDYTQISLNNLGNLKGMTGDLDSAYYFFIQAAENSREEKNLDNYMSVLINLANIDAERGRYATAEAMLDSAYHLAITLKNTEKLAKVQRARADMFALAHDYKKAFTYLDDYTKQQEKFLNEDRVKAVNELMEKYEAEKKAHQIQQLKLENLDATLQNERIRNTRNRYLFAGIGIFLLAIGLYSRLHYVRKSRRAIQHEKDISDGLLLNILPATVAEELKIKGNAEARHFDQATILFSDFKGFTTIAENMSASDLVGELNVCFKAFDEIITRHGIEKIKTIGDSYMAAGSIPDTNRAKATDVVQAGLEMQSFITSRKMEWETRGIPAFEMRVGIHSGPVIAGIVGVKKFQYDIWGDTVNIASRMETAGETGKVNISAATYGLVKDDPSLSFMPRGFIHVKGKGELEMYFVERENVRE